MKRASLLFLLLLCIPALADQYELLGSYRSHNLKGNILTVTTDNRTLELSVFEGGVVKVLVGESEPLPIEVSSLPPQTLSLDEGPQLKLSFPEGYVEVEKEPVRISVYRSDGTLVTADDPAFGHGWDGKEVRCWKRLQEDQRFFGLGEKSGDVNKRGRFFTNWNSDIPAYRNDTDPLYCNIPFFSSVSESKAFGIFFPNSYRSTYNFGAGNDRLFSFGAEDGPLVYYLFPGPTMKDVIEDYSDLTGRMPMPPKWSLGYQQCRWSYYPEYEIRDLAKEFRQRKIPADVLYFDIHYMDAYKVFTWHPERFPNPVQLLSDLQEDGFKTITIIDPGVKVEPDYPVYQEGLENDHFLRYQDGELYRGQVWPGWCHFPDFRRAATRAWWGAKNAMLQDRGVDGFWNDMNEPAVWGKEFPYVVEGIKALHNVYALYMAQATYDGLKEAAPDQRPFIVTRAGWAGIQRYAAVWTGDNSASYDDLALSIRTNIGLGLSGVPFVGCDIGGFIGRPDPELYLRWMQAGSLSPFMRSHTIHDSPDQEPWAFGEETERRCREAIERRYRLMPYLYTELHRAHDTGLPLYRPMWLDFPGEEAAYDNAYQHQFMVGSHLLAAPVIRQGQRFQKVYLPKGDWYEPGTGEIHGGGKAVLVEAGLDTLPLFYRAGAVIPTRPVQQYVDESPLTELRLTVVPGDTGVYEMIVDDGLTTDSPVEKWTFRQNGRDSVRIDLGSGPRAAALQTLKFKVVGAENLKFNGTTLRKEGEWFVASARSGELKFTPGLQGR